jgi:VIT1/CCC1 family predicted Fe2+/Mn2+ transporter
MLCRHCGTEIAEKALICYKCGAATTDAKYQPAPTPRRGLPVSLIVSIVAVALLAVAASYVGRAPDGETPRLFTWIVVAIAVGIVGLRAYARRR